MRLSTPNMNKLPDFYIVGASKAGTTAVCDVLADHPDICFSSKKEPNFFSKFEIGIGEIPAENLANYETLFSASNCEQLYGEGSVGYLHSENAAHWIKHYSPNAKIIILLRNPVKRIVSLYEMYTRIGAIEMDTDDAFATTNFLAKQCLLHQHIMRYVDAFSKENVLIMLQDDFITDQKSSFNRVYDFLSIAPMTIPVMKMRNKGGIAKYNKLGKVLQNRKLIAFAKNILPKSIHRSLDYQIKTFFFKKVDISPQQKTDLEHFFKSDVQKTSELIGRDLCSKWGL